MAYAPYQKMLTGFGAADKASYLPIFNDSEQYRQALSKAVYGEAGRAVSSGLGGISGFLAGQGPLADSGARPALAARLAGNIYGSAANRVGQGYASYLGNALSARRAYGYKLALLRASQPDVGQTLLAGAGGFARGLVGGGSGGGGGGGGYEAGPDYA